VDETCERESCLVRRRTAFLFAQDNAGGSEGFGGESIAAAATVRSGGGDAMWFMTRIFCFVPPETLGTPSANASHARAMMSRGGRETEQVSCSGVNS
jgi:hypothetical protein